MTITHIRLDRSDSYEEPLAILVPLAGTVFELTPSFETLVVLPNGRTFRVHQSFNAIAEAIAVHVSADED